MGDEQTILLGPEEELTSVRERLEKTQARRIILVIPAQTQLRSHVGWRLIHARMRELGKELLVISPDRQVRAVARAAGFQVAETQQEAPSNRPHLGGGTRPGAANARGGSRASRIGSSRGEPASQVPQQPDTRQRLTSQTSKKPMTRPSASGRPGYEEDEDTLERLRSREAEASQRQKSVPATFFDEPEEGFGPAYDFGVRAAPSTRPSVPHRDEDDGAEFKNTYEADYRTAQDILKAAKEGAPAQNNQRQRANAASSHFEEVEEGVSDIADRSTEVMESEIEDLGDLGDLPAIRSDRASSKLGGQQQQSDRPRPGSGPIRPSARRSPRAPRPNTQGFDDDDELLAIPDKPTRGAPNPSRPSRGLDRGQRPSQSFNPSPSAGQRPSQSFGAGASQRPSQSPNPGAGQRRSQPIRLASQPIRPASQPIQPASQPIRPASQAGAGMRVVAGGQRSSNRQSIPSSRPQQMRARRAPQRSSRGMVIFFTALILLIGVAGALLYFVPAATVTISLDASPYTQSVHVNATVNPQANVPNRALAHVLAQNFSASGQGTASGTTKVGNAQGQGFVTFTNTGNKDVTIPTNTFIATPSGIQFATEAEVVVPQGGSQPSVPVTAQQTGESGNVATNTITVIPPASLSSIAQSSHLGPTSVTASSLTVTNEAATSGGGAAIVPAATQRDLQTLAKTLHQKVQQEVQAWLDAQIHTGDVRGQLVPDVLASRGLLNEEQVSATPQVGQPASNKTFSGTLTLHVSILVARAVDVQAAAGAQLNATVLKLHPAKMLATQLPVTLANVQSTPSPDGSILAISADASGELLPQLDLNAIASSITNQGFSQATSGLKNGIGIPKSTTVKDVQISIFPSFFSILPFQAGRIRIILKPIQVTPPPPVKNGP
ncbi:MAG: baseplate J/gp47 family protein [Ktedonobacteraceae bacterium]